MFASVPSTIRGKKSVYVEVGRGRQELVHRQGCETEHRKSSVFRSMLSFFPTENRLVSVGFLVTKNKRNPKTEGWVIFPPSPPPRMYYIHVGLASVANDSVHTMCCPLRELDNERTVFLVFFLAIVHSWRSGCRSFVWGGEPLLRTRGLIASRRVYGKAPTRQSRRTLIAVSGSTPEKNQLIEAVIHVQVRLTSGS